MQPLRSISSPAIVVPREENGFTLVSHQTSPGGRRRNPSRKFGLSDFTFLKVLGKRSFGKVGVCVTFHIFGQSRWILNELINNAFRELGSWLDNWSLTQRFHLNRLFTTTYFSVLKLLSPTILRSIPYFILIKIQLAIFRKPPVEIQKLLKPPAYWLTCKEHWKAPSSG